jgi:enoyl-CoA hydratase
MAAPEVTITDVDGVRHVTLPGGPLTAAHARELTQAAAQIIEDRSVRAVVLDADGADFCTGLAADVDPLTPGLDPTSTLAAVRVPVVAVLRGAVASVGLEIALTADLRLASLDVRCWLPEVPAGRLPCWGGTQRLPRVVGAAEALRLLLLGEPVDAARARDIGLVHEVTPDPAARAREMLTVWAQRGPLAIEYAKEAVLAGAELPVREGLALEADLNTLLQTSTDRAEGIAAFLDKREPRFTGR